MTSLLFNLAGISDSQSKPTSHSVEDSLQSQNTSNIDITGAPAPSCPTAALKHIRFDPRVPIPPPYNNELFKGSIKEQLSTLQDTRTLYMSRLSENMMESHLIEYVYRTGYATELVVPAFDKSTRSPFPGGIQFAFIRMVARHGGFPLVTYGKSQNENPFIGEFFTSHLDFIENGRKLFVGWEVAYEDGLEYGPPDMKWRKKQKSRWSSNASSNISAKPHRKYTTSSQYPSSSYRNQGRFNPRRSSGFASNQDVSSVHPPVSNAPYWNAPGSNMPPTNDWERDPYSNQSNAPYWNESGKRYREDGHSGYPHKRPRE